MGTISVHWIPSTIVTSQPKLHTPFFKYASIGFENKTYGCFKTEINTIIPQESLPKNKNEIILFRGRLLYGIMEIFLESA